MLPHFADRLLLPLRLRRARARGLFRPAEELGEPLVAEAFDLAFPQGEASYNGIGQAPDGTILFAIGTKGLEAGARLFAFDPESSSVRVMADLDPALTPPGRRAIPQGKVHVDLVAAGGMTVGATHIGYYDPRSAVERPGTAPGYAPYPGGWFFAVEDDRVVPLAQAPAGEGIITMSVDVERRVAFALTWPRGLFLTYDLDAGTLRNYGAVMGAGETGSKNDGTWWRICRSLAVEPTSGAVFWSDERGRIGRFDGSSIEMVGSTPRGELWRKVVWHPSQRVFYGVLWRSSTLFRFDPATLSCEELGMLGVPPSPATLAFALDPDGRTLHALAAGPGVLRDGQIQLAGSVTHLTYDVGRDLGNGTQRASGPLRLPDGRWVTQSQSLLLAGAYAYSLCWVEVPPGDRSPRAREIRALRRRTREYRGRGYAEEMMLVRFRYGGE